jgi:hypothetical protein
MEELKSEILRLESESNLDSEEFKQLKLMKEELKKLEAEIEAELEKKGLSVRPLQRRDLQVLQTLVKDYPGFKNLPEGDQLDRMVLVLTNVCGFGGVLASTLSEALEQIRYRLSLDVEEHFKNSIWTNREGETRKRYVNNFASAFKLEPGLSIKLMSEGEDSSQEEPIRKSVAGKKPAPAEIRQSTPEELSKQGVRRQELVRPPDAAEPASASSPISDEKRSEKKGTVSRLFSLFKK